MVTAGPAGWPTSRARSPLCGLEKLPSLEHLGGRSVLGCPSSQELHQRESRRRWGDPHAVRMSRSTLSLSIRRIRDSKQLSVSSQPGTEQLSAFELIDGIEVAFGIGRHISDVHII